MAITSAPGQDGITASIYNEYADQLNYPIKKMARFFKKWKIATEYQSSSYNINL